MVLFLVLVLLVGAGIQLHLPAHASVPFFPYFAMALTRLPPAAGAAVHSIGVATDFSTNRCLPDPIAHRSVAD